MSWDSCPCTAVLKVPDPMEREQTTIDGNEAAALIVHATNEVIAIYPITPASPMGELSDA